MRNLSVSLALVAGIGLVAAAAGEAQVVATSSGDVALFSGLNQKNIVDHLIVGDSVEVAMAQLAVSRTTNAAVRDFATMLVTDHTAHLDNLRKLAGKRDIGREALAADTSGAHLIRRATQLQSMPADSNFDRAFIRAQIAHHTREIAAFPVMKPQAKDDDLQHDMDRTLPVLQKHLTQAQQVAAQLGISLTPTMKPDSAKKPPQR